MNEGFIKLPRSLLNSPRWQSLPLAYQNVFLTILNLVCFKPQKFDDHGHIIDLKPGQVCISERELQKKCSKYVSRNQVQRAIIELKVSQLLSQEVSHTKSILTVKISGIYEELKNQSEPTYEPTIEQKVSQEVSHKRRREERKNVKEEEKINKKEKNLQKKKAVREWVDLTEIEEQTLFENHGEDLANLMLDILDAYNDSRQKHYDRDYAVLKKGGWVQREALKQSKNTKPQNPYEYSSKIALEYTSPYWEIQVKHSEICFIPLQGEQQQPVTIKFTDYNFKDQVHNVLRSKKFTQNKIVPIQSKAL